MNEYMTYKEYRAARKTALQRFLGGVAVMFVWLVAIVTLALLVERQGGP